jgi:hypothetical protein
MSLGEWGIVAGVGAVLGAFFLSMELLYSHARNGANRKGEASPDHRMGEGIKDARHPAA